MVEERRRRRNVEKTCDSHRRGSRVGDHLWRNASLIALPAVRACRSGREPRDRSAAVFTELVDRRSAGRQGGAKPAAAGGAVAIAGALVFYFLVKRYLGGPRGS